LTIHSLILNKKQEIMKVHLEPILSLLIAAVFHISATSAQVAHKEVCGSPYLQVISERPQQDRVVLKETRATVNITGVIANVKVEQFYINNGEYPIEAIYVFPGSTQAAVHGMTMSIGERRIVARISEKEKARQAYDQAKQEGRSASLLEQHRPNVFQMNVSNIMPGDSLTVELRYSELLAPTDGVYSFVYPTVVGPRYNGDTGTEVATATGGWITNPYQREGDAPLYAFHMSGTLNVGMPLQRAICTTHDLDITFSGANSAKFQLKAGQEHTGDRDFIFNYHLRGNAVETGVMLYQGKNENFFLAMIEPPKRITPDQIPPREYLFVVDVSGSMNGFPIAISKDLMRELLGGLRPTDRFNVLLFASGYATLSPQALPATKENIEKGIRLVDNQRGGGGTQLLPALREALKNTVGDGYSRTVVVATDGYITVDREAIDLIRNNLGEANFFTFGIGSSVNRYLLEGMAKAGKGESFVLTSAQEAKAGAAKFRSYIDSPVLTNIKVQFDGLTVYDVEPSHVPDVFAERPIIIQGKYKGGGYGKLKITGTSGAGKYVKEVDVSPALASANNEALKFLWARKRIELLDDLAQFGRTDEAEKEVLALGMKYGLLTQYTSFIAEDSEIRNSGGRQTTVVQPLPLPKGVSEMAIGQSTRSQAGVGALGRAYDMSMEMAAVRSAAQEKHEVQADVDAKDKERKASMIATKADVMPAFEGGEAALQRYLIQKLGLSKDELVQVRSARPKVSMVVQSDGSLAEVKVLGNIDASLRERIMKVIKSMPRWKAGVTDGAKVAVRMEWMLNLE
jgi:Ca-activated chloride channel homolog